MSKHPKEVILDYTNRRGDRRTYRVRPMHLAFEFNEWHPETQWLLHAMLVPSNEFRTFAMINIHSWQPG